MACLIVIPALNKTAKSPTKKETNNCELKNVLSKLVDLSYVHFTYPIHGEVHDRERRWL